MYNSADEFDIGKAPMVRKEQGRKKNQSQSNHATAPTLKAVSKYVGLTPGTASAVLNNSLTCWSVSERKRNRVFAPARELEYKPERFA
jgi:hypothetical protein